MKTIRKNYQFSEDFIKILSAVQAAERRSETQVIEIAVERMAATLNLLPLTASEGKKKKKKNGI